MSVIIKRHAWDEQVGCCIAKKTLIGVSVQGWDVSLPCAGALYKSTFTINLVCVKLSA
jgi:hypothetical protein